ncbi:MAG: complex I NDUFA9 subunit family protein [Halobacteriota archaeon]
MRVFVAGGTGFIGTALCRSLAGDGHEVTAASRSADAEALPAGVTAARIDLTDPDGLPAQLDGHDAAVNLVSLSPLFKPPSGLTHDEVHRRGTERLLAAAEEAGVDRFVQMSAISADPEATTAYLRAKGRAEAAVRGSDLEWTILRPSVVFGDGGEFIRFTRWVSFPPFIDRLAWPYASPLPGARVRFQPIWIGDFAPLVAEVTVGDGHGGETYELGGPAVFTLAEITRLVHRAEGKPARLVPFPTSLAKLGLSVAGAVPGFPLGADQGRALELDNVATDNDVEALGRSLSELRTLEAYLGLVEEIPDG